jgi:type II secretory pathway component PulM
VSVNPSEIAAKLADALSMFWQSLDERERRLLALGAVWVAVSLAMMPLERRRKEREEAELIERLAAAIEVRQQRG